MNLEDFYSSEDKGFYIMNNFDMMYLDGKFDEVNEVIKSIKLDGLDSSTLRAICVAIKWVEEKLPYAKQFYQLAYSKMLELKGKPLADRLLWFTLDK